MIAVDTNIVVRLIVGDDEAQVQKALALAARETFYISFTALMETEWVLRSRYGYDRTRICTALTELAKVVTIALEQEADARWALARYAVVGELADYLHIAAARSIGRFASFEDKLARRAGVDAPSLIEIPA